MINNSDTFVQLFVIKLFIITYMLVVSTEHNFSGIA